jgi:hypothetical protein
MLSLVRTAQSTQATFNREVLERLPAEARGQACICPACAQTLPAPRAADQPR